MRTVLIGWHVYLFTRFIVWKPIQTKISSMSKYSESVAPSELESRGPDHISGGVKAGRR